MAEVRSYAFFLDRPLEIFGILPCLPRKPLEIALKTTSSCGIWLAFKSKKEVFWPLTRFGRLLTPFRVALIRIYFREAAYQRSEVLKSVPCTRNQPEPVSVCGIGPKRNLLPGDFSVISL